METVKNKLRSVAYFSTGRKKGTDLNCTTLNLKWFGGGTLVPPITGLKPRLPGILIP
jgi:hypothetical protein